MKTINIYKIPIDLNQVTNIEYESESHLDDLRYSVDYDAPIGSKIFAAADGVIIDIKDDSNEGGLDKKFESLGNYIEILHNNNEVSEYEHIKFGSAKVKIGDKVKTGDLIAEVGNTGWSACPHLHFMVYPKGKEYQTLEINFGM
jgi:murein DD-endopeptidase MepM/ murein hydrolase activator NlpD